MKTEPNAYELVGRTLIELSPIVFFRLDAFKKIVGTNSFTRKIMGFDPCGQGLEDVLLLFGASLDLEEVCKNPGQTRLFSIPTIHGLPETMYFSFIPFDRETLVLGTLDPDETARLRKELILANNSLSALTRELQKKNQELAELNRLKNQFLGMAAHDLRKPVNAVLSYCEFLLDEASSGLSSEHLGFLKTIHTSTSLMRSIIDDFLDVSLIESGRLPIEKRRADPREVVENSVRLMEALAKRRHIRLSISEKGTPTRIEMDPSKIEQVLLNLISNALEHSPEGSEVRTAVVVKEAEIEISVTDEGPGIGDKERLFTFYARGKSKKSYKSAGLGLAISKGIIEAHGGKIWVESKPGKGSSFIFSLPKGGSL